jgi:hypothetical protein
MPLPWGFLKRVLAGAIFGLYMAHLLYFLNPQIDITPARLATVTLAYGLTCGVLFGSILWLLRLARLRIFGRPDIAEYRRHGFGLVVAAAFISTAVYWMHLEVFRIYLPVGAVRILSKATIVIGVTAFLLLLLWLIERSARTNVSRAILAIGCALIAVSSFFLYQRRERYRTDRKTVVVADAGSIGRRPVVLVSVRNLPYDWIVTLAGEGTLPFFEQSMTDAFVARIEPFTTTSSKELWASLATGQLPHRHGVTGGYSYHTALNAPDERFLLLPSGVGFRVWGLIPPVDRISAQLPSGQSLPVWAMFERLGIDARVIGWPGVPEPGGQGAIAERVPEGQIPEEVTQRFVAAPPEIRRRVFAALRSDLAAEDAARQAVRGGYALTAVALNGFSVTEALLGVDSNVLPDRTAAEGAMLRAYLEQIDAFLREIEQIEPQAVLIVVSASGPDPIPFPGSPVGIVRWLLQSRDPGRDDGFIVVRGSGVRPREPRTTAAVTDVVPTVLFAGGLPVARDFDGRALIEAFDEGFLAERPLSMIQTYEAERLVVR